MVRSLPPDEMHLWFENISPDLVQHWRAKFCEAPVVSAQSTKGYQEYQEEDDKFAENNGNVTNDGNHAEQASIQTKKQKLNDGSTQLPESQQQPKTRKTNKGDTPRLTKFDPTECQRNICPVIWDKMDRDMKDSLGTFPSYFGDALHNFWEHSRHLKAAELVYGQHDAIADISK
ncbi:hypothetical protein BDD12DRAFT_807899 [Trichophaea hybrida]|nr:hypothetical protein BDD12DRAFT_807899 [Trichophaea hybrida]